MPRFAGMVVCFGLAGLAAAAEEKPILVLNGPMHTAKVNRVLFTPDGRQLITVSSDKSIRFWETATGMPRGILRPPIGPELEGMLFAAALSPDGSLLAVGGYTRANSRWYIYLISMATGRMEKALAGHKNAITDLAFSPDGDLLASASADGTARIWEWSSGKTFQVLSGHEEEVTGVAFSPDGGQIATASLDSTARIWSVRAGKSRGDLMRHRGGDRPAGIHSIAWSPNGILATGGEDQTIRFWNSEGKSLGALPGLGNNIKSLAFSAKSPRLLFTRGMGEPPFLCFIVDFRLSKNGRSLTVGDQPVQFAGHAKPAVHGAFSPDGRLAATAGGDGNNFFLWETQQGELVRPWTNLEPALNVAWSPDSKAIAWGPQPGTQEGTRWVAQQTKSFHLGDLQFGPRPDDTYRSAVLDRGGWGLSRGEDSLDLWKNRRPAGQLKVPGGQERVLSYSLIGDDRAIMGTTHSLTLYDLNKKKDVLRYLGHTGLVWAVAPSPDGKYILSAGSDQTMRIWTPDRAEPLLSLFFAGNDWIAWTREGFYAASPGGEKLIGWQVNQGPDQLAVLHPAANFHESLYRPDVIQRLLEAGSVERALAQANQARPRKPPVVKPEEVGALEVRIVSPERTGSKVDQAALEIKAVARGAGKYPITIFRLLEDGQPYEAQKNIERVPAAADSGEVSKSWQVKLNPGVNRFRVRAQTDVNHADSEIVEVIYAVGGGAKTADKPKLYVLAIGVANYQMAPKLQVSADDARKIAATFATASKDLYDVAAPWVLTDAEATKDNILTKVEELREKMTSRDVAIFFFSGHGDKDKGNLFYFAPVDYNPQRPAGTGVPGDQVKNILQTTQGRIVMFLDTCHAGAVGGNWRQAEGDFIRGLNNSDHGVLVMCSSMSAQKSEESKELKRSFFTHALIQGLSGQADLIKDGTINTSELWTYLEDEVPKLTNGRQNPDFDKKSNIPSFDLAGKKRSVKVAGGK